MPPKQKWDSMSCSELFQEMANENKLMDETSFSEMFTNALKLDAESVLQFMLLTRCMKVERAAQIEQHHLQNLFDYCKVKTVKDLQKKVPSLEEEMKKPAVFKEVYRATYPLFLVKQYTTLDIDYAEALWSILLKGKFNYLKELYEYLEFLGEKKPVKVHKDLWNMMLEFAQVVKDVQKDYSENDAWPLFIDNFVEWMQQKK